VANAGSAVTAAARDGSPPAVAAVEPAALEWSGARRLGFRFLFSYLALYNLQGALGWFPGTAWLREGYLGIWRAAVVAAGRHVLRLHREIGDVANGSGDRTFDYVQVVCMAAAAVLAALAWTIADRRRRQYRLLAEGLRIYLRYALAAVLLAQGLRTVLQLELPFPSLDRLSERIGDSSPLALYSTFMGTSRLYAAVTGGAAAAAGILLWFRRTMALGVLLSLGVIANEVMLSFSYDVPRKLASLHMLLMAAIVLAPQARRLVDGLLLGRPTQPADLAPPLAGRRAGVARLAVKTLVIGYVAAATTLAAAAEARRLRLAPRPPIYGIYEVEDFSRNGRDVALGLAEPSRWRQLIVESPATLEVRFLDGSRRSFRSEYGPRGIALRALDAAGTTATTGTTAATGTTATTGTAATIATIATIAKAAAIAMAATAAKPGELGTMAWSRPAPDRLLLRGTFAGAALSVALRRIDDGFLLVARPFRLVIDEPINR
jgi:hypothetical protein